MIAPTHVVVDTRDGYVYSNDGHNGPMTEATAIAFRDKRNEDSRPQCRTYVAFKLAPLDAPTYPTWKKISDIRWESEERIDGTPDFILVKQLNVGTGGPLSPVRWGLKGRTSAKWTMYFGRTAVAQAKADVARDTARN